jgi:hypothetical protein
MGLFGVQ